MPSYVMSQVWPAGTTTTTAAEQSARQQQQQHGQLRGTERSLEPVPVERGADLFLSGASRRRQTRGAPREPAQTSLYVPHSLRLSCLAHLAGANEMYTHGKGASSTPPRGSTLARSHSLARTPSTTSRTAGAFFLVAASFCVFEISTFGAL